MNRAKSWKTWSRTLAFVAVAACVTVACTSDRAVGPSAKSVRSALEEKPPETSTFQIAAQEQVDWPKLVGGLSKSNVFRVVYRAHANAKGPADDGVSSLPPDEQKIHRDFTTDMNEVYAIYHHRGPVLGEADKARVNKLQGTYAKDRQEVLDVVMQLPNLSATAKQALRTSIGHANGARAMGLVVP